MTDEKVQEAARRMRAGIGGAYPELGPERIERARPSNWLEVVRHLLWMCDRIVDLIAEEQREKAMRWLGFVQGVCWSSGLYSLDELKAMNPPDGAETDPARE